MRWHRRRQATKRSAKVTSALRVAGATNGMLFMGQDTRSKNLPLSIADHREVLFGRRHCPVDLSCHPPRPFATPLQRRGMNESALSGEDFRFAFLLAHTTILLY